MMNNIQVGIDVCTLNLPPSSPLIWLDPCVFGGGVTSLPLLRCCLSDTYGTAQALVISFNLIGLDVFLSWHNMIGVVGLFIPASHVCLSIAGLKELGLWTCTLFWAYFSLLAQPWDFYSLEWSILNYYVLRYYWGDGKECSAGLTCCPLWLS